MKNIRYINVKVKDDIWVINRISNLIRKRNYNITQISASFDSQWLAHIIIWIDLREMKIEQIISQLEKLYDVVEVNDLTFRKSKLKWAFYVHTADKKHFENLSYCADKIMETDDSIVWFYLIDVDKVEEFIKELDEKNFYYTRKVVSMV